MQREREAGGTSCFAFYLKFYFYSLAHALCWPLFCFVFAAAFLLRIFTLACQLFLFTIYFVLLSLTVPAGICKGRGREAERRA